MYSIYAYGRMIADRPRTRAYAEALRRTVTPGAVVADLGAGTGIFALLACGLGASRVYAVEPSDAIHVARQIAEANGYADRITFIQEISSNVTLPEAVDVIVSDMRGMLPLYGAHITSIIDARERMLAPGGALIPQCDRMRVAVVEAPELYEKFANPWDRNDYGLDMTAGSRFVMNSWDRQQVKPEQLLAPAQTWATLDYPSIQQPNASGEVTWSIERAGTAHGLAMWFDAVLREKVEFTNAPGAPELIYGCSFWPWTRPVALSDGDTVSVRLGADLVGMDYIWRWETTVLACGDRGQVKAHFEQSSFHGMLLFPSRLRKRSESHEPALGDEGRIDRLILDMMDGATRLAEIAHRVRERFPARFATSKDSLERVRKLSERYSL